jgi:hypothetical protein
MELNYYLYCDYMFNAQAGPSIYERASSCCKISALANE